MLGKLFNKWAMKRQVKEATDFLGRLKSMNSDELGIPLVVTLEAAEMIREEKGLDVFDPFATMATDPSASFYYSTLAIKLQKMEREILAPGAMVWAHTLRATVNHEIRNLVRQIWVELNRGSPFVENARHDLMSLYQIWPNLDRVGETPVGMEAGKQ